MNNDITPKTRGGGGEIPAAAGMLPANHPLRYWGIATRLKEARVEAELTVDEVAEWGGVKPEDIEAYERGIADLPLLVAARLVAGYGVTLDWLVSGDPEDTSDRDGSVDHHSTGSTEEAERASSERWVIHEAGDWNEQGEPGWNARVEGPPVGSPIEVVPAMTEPYIPDAAEKT